MTNVYIIGSYIQAYPKGNDFDALVDPNADYDAVRAELDKEYGVPGRTKIEIHNIPALYNYLQRYQGESDVYQELDNLVVRTAYFNSVGILRASHMFWDINWEKHKRQIKSGILDSPERKKLFIDLVSHWESTHGPRKHSDLSLADADFFNNNVRCPYDHDWLHTLINPDPTYNKVIKQDGKVTPYEELFDKLLYTEKYSLVVEEIYVMAWERYRNVDTLNRSGKAFERMFKQFYMRHAPLWEAYWIACNMDAFVGKVSINFMQVLDDAVEQAELAGTAVYKQT